LSDIFWSPFFALRMYDNRMVQCVVLYIKSSYLLGILI